MCFRYEMCQDGYTDDITRKTTPAQLIARRGQEIKVKLTMNQDYNSSDQIRVVANIGRQCYYFH